MITIIIVLAVIIVLDHYITIRNRHERHCRSINPYHARYSASHIAVIRWWWQQQ